MKPIFHLSFPVRCLKGATEFYVERLGATLGRQNEDFADVFVFDAQVTLYSDRQNVATPMPRSCHFGATVGWAAWEDITRRLEGNVTIVEGPRISYLGEPTEQAKLMIADPSGNLIEIKAYRNPEKVLGRLAG